MKMISSPSSPEASWLSVERAEVALLFLAALIVLAGQANLELFTLDDVREAEVAREMLVDGDVVVPHLAGLPFVEKPPGFPLVLSTAFRLAGGPGAKVARIVCAMFALASLAAVYLLGRRAIDRVGGAMAALVLSLSMLFCRTAHEVLLDNALTATVAWALFFGWVGWESTEPSTKRRAYAAAGLLAGLSFLVKGFVGPAILGSSWLGMLLVTRKWRELFGVFHPLTLAAFLLPALAWVIPFARMAPDRLHEFFWDNHFGRALHAYASHPRPFYYYFMTTWWKFAPGSILLPFAGIAAWRARRAEEGRAGILFLAASLGPMILLSISRAKDSIYLLPVYPALALLVAWGCLRFFSAQSGRAFAALVTLGTVSAAAAGVAAAGTWKLGGFSLLLALAAVAFLFSLVVFALAVRRRDQRQIGLALALFLSMGYLLALVGPAGSEYVARRTFRGTFDAIFQTAGDRELLLYRPDDEQRGGCGFWRNRTAVEIDDPAILVDRLRHGPQTVVALIGRPEERLFPELRSAADAAGVRLVEELRIGYLETKWLGLIRAAPDR